MLFDAESVPVGAEGEDRFDVVPTIRTFPAHMKREVELGGRDIASDCAQGAAFAGVSPVASFAFTRLAMSSSAVTSDASHANRAS